MHVTDIDALVEPFWADVRVQYFCLGVCGCLIVVTLLFSAICLAATASQRTERRRSLETEAAAEAFADTGRDAYVRVRDDDETNTERRLFVVSTSPDDARHTRIAFQETALLSDRNDEASVNNRLGGGLQPQPPPLALSSACTEAVAAAPRSNPVSPLCASPEPSAETLTPTHALLLKASDAASSVSPPAHQQACTPVNASPIRWPATVDSSHQTPMHQGETSSERTEGSAAVWHDAAVQARLDAWPGQTTDGLEKTLVAVVREFDAMCVALEEAEADMLELTEDADRQLRLSASQQAVEQCRLMARLTDRLERTPLSLMTSRQPSPRQSKSPRTSVARPSTK